MTLVAYRVETEWMLFADDANIFCSGKAIKEVKEIVRNELNN